MSKIKLKDFLKENDVKFLLSKTKLSHEKLSLLIEENYDFDLVFSTLAAQKHTKTELKKLSPWLYFRYLVFKYSGENLPFEEKSFVADILPSYVERIFSDTEKGKYKLNLDKMSEDKAIYLFIFLSFFKDDVKHGIKDFPLQKFYNEIESVFRSSGRRDFAVNLMEWVKVIEEITKKDDILFVKYREADKAKKCNLCLEPAKTTDSQ